MASIRQAGGCDVTRINYLEDKAGPGDRNECAIEKRVVVPVNLSGAINTMGLAASSVSVVWLIGLSVSP